MNTIAIKTKSMMFKLTKRGYRVLNVTPNREDNTKFVYIFERTDDLINSMNEISDEKKVKNKLTDDDIDYIKNILMKHLVNVMDDEIELDKLNLVIAKLHKMKSIYKEVDLSKIKMKPIHEVLAKLQSEMQIPQPDITHYLKYIKR